MALATPAAAVYYTTVTTNYKFDLEGSATSITNGLRFSDTEVDKSTSKLLKITVDATAWNATKVGTNTTYTFSKASLVQYSGGLGVTSSYDSPGTCGTGGCNSHEIDNLGSSKNSTSVDFIRLDFSQAVVLGGFGQTVYPSLYADQRTKNGAYQYQYDDDYSVGVLTDDPKTNVSTSLSGISNLGSIFTVGDPNTVSCTGYNNNPCSDTATLWNAANSANITASKTWYVAASILNNYGGDGNPDGFKLANLNVYYNVRTAHPTAMPEPASWMTMIVGFGAAGAALRRARRLKIAAA